jgi:hypothetical protein
MSVNLQKKKDSGRLRENELGYFEIAEADESITPEMVKAASEDDADACWRRIERDGLLERLEGV